MSLPSQLSKEAWIAIFIVAALFLLITTTSLIFYHRRRHQPQPPPPTPSSTLRSITIDAKDTPTPPPPAMKPKSRISQMITSFSPPVKEPVKERSDSRNVLPGAQAQAVNGGGGCGFVTPKLAGPPVNAVEAFRRRGEDEVGVRVGDPIGVYHRFEDGWVYGMNWRSGVSGVFPGSVLPATN